VCGRLDVELVTSAARCGTVSTLSYCRDERRRGRHGDGDDRTHDRPLAAAAAAVMAAAVCRVTTDGRTDGRTTDELTTNDVTTPSR